MWYNDCFNIRLNCTDNGKKSINKLNKMKNEFVFQNTFFRYVETALQRYSIENLDDTMNERTFLESLLWHGQCAIAEIEPGKLINLPCNPFGGYNLYGDFTNGYLYSKNGIIHEQVEFIQPGEKELDLIKKSVGYIGDSKIKAVYIRETSTTYPFINYVIQYAEQIADIYRSIEVCAKNLKSPYLIVCPDTVKDSILKCFEQRDENNQLILGTGIMNADEIEIKPFDSDSGNLNALCQTLDYVENKFRVLCGGYGTNMSVDKKGENLTTDELHIGDEASKVNIDLTLKFLNKSLQLANDYWGRNFKAVAKHQDEYNLIEDKEEIEYGDEI